MLLLVSSNIYCHTRMKAIATTRQQYQWKPHVRQYTNRPIVSFILP